MVPVAAMDNCDPMNMTGVMVTSATVCNTFGPPNPPPTPIKTPTMRMRTTFGNTGFHHSEKSNFRSSADNVAFFLFWSWINLNVRTNKKMTNPTANKTQIY